MAYSLTLLFLFLFFSANLGFASTTSLDILYKQRIFFFFKKMTVVMVQQMERGKEIERIREQ